MATYATSIAAGWYENLFRKRALIEPSKSLQRALRAASVASWWYENLFLKRALIEP